MLRHVPLIIAAAMGVTLLAGAATAPARATAPPRELRTAVFDPTLAQSQDAELALARVRAVGAHAVRIILYWRDVAPSSGSVQRPPNFDAADASHPGYAFQDFDRLVTFVASRGLEPIVGIQLAPRWAERATTGPPGTRAPDARELGSFARAVARRYSGAFGGLPRVRYFQIWNEPNLGVFLSPQARAPQLYRAMVNQASAAVHSVHASNVVIAGGTAPFGRFGSANGTPPLSFMRDLLCLAGRTKPKPVCRTRIEFDVWAHNPYTLGEPTRQARGPDNASIGDLPEMKRLLDAAVSARNVTSARRPEFWVTEFSWDSSPPDPKGVPAALHARWVSEALYRMWQAGVSLATWFQLRDQPLGVSPFQSGLHYDDGRPKAAATSFRFPFVAFSQPDRVLVWGRTPPGKAGAITIERARGNAWTRIASLRSNAAGIFTARLRTARSGRLRARTSDGETTVPFALARPRPLTLQNPFGS